MDKPENGRIIWGEFIDTRGNRAGPHRAVIITSNQDIAAGKPLRVVVISSNLNMADAADMVELPYLKSALGHVHTRLKQKCAAICTWIPEISKEDITDYGGWVRGKWMVAILKRVSELEDQDERDDSSTHS